MKHFILFLAAATAFGCARAAADDERASGDRERQRAKVVSRLYETTQRHAARCAQSTPDAAQDFAEALAGFNQRHAALMQRVTGSPHYAAAEARFKRRDAEEAPGTRPGPEARVAECRYVASLLRSMTDTEAGRQAVQEFEALLSE